MIIADLHIHSKYSRATSKDGIPEYLDLWARRKGIGLLGTGDFTHPAWREELREKLVPAEDGLYRLREDARIYDDQTDSSVPRFVISGEISSIYKKNGKTRKVHNVILLPSLEKAELLSQKLEAIGNIHSDGRPILGLDSHDLLAITMETCPEAIFIPAHIWTPHFSLFGAFSGFDTIEECFEDLTPYIHALETGLSSDPPMNWRISALDGYTLVSNSDAHSPAKLGREANLLDIEPSYHALSKAIQTGEGFAGTIEFFPEEGKYHYDGHRNCQLCLTPAEAEQFGGKCPVCGKKLTIGVDHRVLQLADREEGFQLPNAKPFESLVPLPEVIAASIGVSASSKKTLQQYENMLKTLGPEFPILRALPLEDIERAAGPCVAEGIRRLRIGQVERIPGYDGQYGIIKLLDKSEIDAINGQVSLFAGFAPVKKAVPSVIEQHKNKLAQVSDTLSEPKETHADSTTLFDGLNQEQYHAVTADTPVVAVIAGPGTGKTKTLVSKIAYLVEQKGVSPSEITAVTFTNKAAAEMRERLEKRLGGKRAVRAMTIGTFHSICMELLGKVTLIDEYDAWTLAESVIKQLGLKVKPRQLLQAVSNQKNGLSKEESFPQEALDLYCSRLQEIGVLDFDDLLLQTLEMMKKNSKFQNQPFSYLLVDEFQDINQMQYQLIHAWNRNGKELFVIGDPDQSIYGFRGSDANCFSQLKEDNSQYSEIHLVKNYRSSPEILGCALPVISQNEGAPRSLEAVCQHGAPVRVIKAESTLSEGIAVAKEINRMVGGIDMLDTHTFGIPSENRMPRGFSDIAILYRTHRQAEMLEKCLRKESIPYFVTGRENYLSDDQVRAAICFFRFLLNPADIPALHTCLKVTWNCPEDLCLGFSVAWQKAQSKEITPALFELICSDYQQVGMLQQWMKQMKHYMPIVKKTKPRELLESWLTENQFTGPSTEKLLNAAVFAKDIKSFLQNLQFGQEGDLKRSSAKHYPTGNVTLMTLHGSKGLEFPVVFLCGVNKGFIPYESANHPADPAEERRLFYVGMTRAKEELILLTSSDPSVFLDQLPESLIHRESTSGRRQHPDGVQLSLF